ncbi:1998_t:CDS:2 [Entrophospora sp. SA101]|nr:5680_t:CDS:2 [Entrophospora sp. SA101]CAJ0648820.1 15192_t:CDS:2 [Entrophospora sp. SA101]CAJ0750735.1 4215_t:CDS:2 [Entrophospora sp. SA101]CAJ0759486.1 1998_t:CDS:2 [Entrophospora sp. SA101]CAJ0839412.1 12486_t:CDS:2 [Entrophospora sp. SA101]
MFPGNQHTYNSADNVVNEGVDNNNIYLMNSSIHLLSVEFHLQNLILRLVLLRNLTPKQGLCNGTRLAIINMTDNVIEAQILCGDHSGELTFIPRITLTPSTSELPLFSEEDNLRTPVFSHGQLYVALSCGTSPHNIKVLLPLNDINTTTNVVYLEVL